MFQDSRRSSLLATDLYLFLLLKPKAKNGVDFDEVGYLHNEKVFRYKVLSIFIIYKDLSFGSIALKIKVVVFVYELINYLFNYL